MWNGKRYHSFDYDCRERFGTKLYKLSLNAGFSCPNRDGTLDTRGCIFCSAGGSGEFAADKKLSITQQIEQAKQLVASKNTSGRYIAYFQAYTNTYAPLPALEQVFFEAAGHPDIAALSIATRPDCLGSEVLSLLARLNKFRPVTVELGLQTIHAVSAAFIRRGYPLSVYTDAVRALNALGIGIVTHLILGLPGETRQDMLASVRHVCSLPLTGIKLSLLHVLKGTDLAAHYAAYPAAYPLMEFSSYLETLLSCLAAIPEDIVIHRLTGDGPKKLLIAPLWSANKKFVLNSIEKEMKRRDFRQGISCTQNPGQKTTLDKKHLIFPRKGVPHATRGIDALQANDTLYSGQSRISADTDAADQFPFGEGIYELF